MSSGDTQVSKIKPCMFLSGKNDNYGEIPVSKYHSVNIQCENVMLMFIWKNKPCPVVIRKCQRLSHACFSVAKMIIMEKYQYQKYNSMNIQWVNFMYMYMYMYMYIWKNKPCRVRIVDSASGDTQVSKSEPCLKFDKLGWAYGKKKTALRSLKDDVRLLRSECICCSFSSA